MSEIPKTYEPQAIEEKWYAQWLADGCFTADPASKKPAYSIVIPPPNVTGRLTLGHVLNNTIQDILARRARMQGKEVLWLPGTDHAGIATQTVVEKTLRKEGAMKHRDDLGREALVAKIWEWKEKYGGIIIEQLKKLGASCDWSRERFTLDPDYSRCVQRVFVDLYKKGLIYRGKRMVNWCPASLTALSDEEVEMKPQNGTLYYFKVEIADEPGTTLTIATTRPETIPGDTAIAVNPKDARYAHLIGKKAVRPLPANMPREERLIPIIGDDHVEFEFGTGVLKVTPAHDKADFEIRQRATIRGMFEENDELATMPIVDIINPDGTMNALAGESLVGLDRFEARKVAAEKLRELGALEKEEPYQNNVGYSERAGVPIEHRLSEQWFLKYPSVEQARKCVAELSGNLSRHSETQPPPVEVEMSDFEKEHAKTFQTQFVKSDAMEKHALAHGGEFNPEIVSHAPATPLEEQVIAFKPERWSKVYDHWLSGIQDWCISRQLWWGHRIPAWDGHLTQDFFDAVPQPALISLKDHLEAVDTNSLGRTVKKNGVEVSLSSVEGHKTFFHFGQEKGKAMRSASGDPIVGAVTTSELEGQILARFAFTQDPDVLDTWFSSWLWPFATMGWTGDKEIDSKNPTLAKFYPTTDLVTGPDIIFFWVARMIMAGFEWMGELPFKNVYFTGIIRDKQGRKMSKMLGNSPDPLDLIAKYGADALRIGVMRSAPSGQDVMFDDKNVELGRNFCTKLWNAARFRQMQAGETEGEINATLLTSDDKWILRRLDGAIREVSQALDEYRFSDAAQGLYRFFWNEYCDWYLEASKAALNGADAARKANATAVIDFVLAHALRLFHPFLPFITEELWHDLGFHDELPEDQGGKTIMFAHWPAPLDDDFKSHYGLTSADDAFAASKYEVVNQGRVLRRDFNIASNKRVRFVLRPSGALAPHDVDVLRILLNAEPFDVLSDYEAPKGTPTALTPLGTLYLPLEGLVDASAERERLKKEIAKVEDELGKVRAKLANPNFAGKVPPAVLDEHKQREAAWAEKLAQLQRMIEALGE